MKHFLLSLVYFISLAAVAKQPAALLTDSSKNKISRPASFPGGLDEWRKFLVKNIDSNILPDSVIAYYGVSSLTVIVTFVVEKDGSLSNITVENPKKHHPVMVAETIRIIQKSPKWEPALKKGKPIRSYFKQPIHWEIEEE